MKSLFLSITAVVMLAIGYVLGWYSTKNNIPNQFTCNDIGNFHADYLNLKYPEASQFQRNELNRQIKTICDADPRVVDDVNEAIQ